MNKLLTICIILLFIGSVSSSAGFNFEKDSTIPLLDGKTLYVGGSGPGNYTKIQDAIDNASDGDTVYVYNGTYFETLIINKSIHLIGESKNQTLIYCTTGITTGNPDGILISSNKVTIKNFHLINTNTLSGNVGINIQSSNTEISNTLLFNHDVGINISRGTRNNTVTLNTILKSEIYGISTSASDYNILSENNISVSGLYGIYITGSNNNLVVGNSVSECDFYGVRIKASDNNEVCGNTLVNNNRGMYLCCGSADNIVFHNNFKKNSEWNANDDGINNWNNGYPIGGNYWDDYNGTDTNGDGIGDIPYDIPGGDNQDRYPLMHPFEQYYILNISVPLVVDEGSYFEAVVRSIGGTPIPDAWVAFYGTGLVKLTDSNGRANFTAPQVESNTLYDIKASKANYTGDRKTILVQDVPNEYKKAFIVGRLCNRTNIKGIIIFNAVHIRCRTLFPFTVTVYKSGELILVQDYFGIITEKFILALCDAVIEKNYRFRGGK